MPGKCEHGLTTKECFVCASPKHGPRPGGSAETPREAFELEPEDPADFGLVYEPGRHLIELVRELLQTHDVASMFASLQFAADALEAELDGDPAITEKQGCPEGGEHECDEDGFCLGCGRVVK